MAINISKMTTPELLEYDKMMVEATPKLDVLSNLSIVIWREVLKELVSRKVARAPFRTGHHWTGHP